eukprot:TRINITY_DN24343_c0_g1_i2.p1 TRINITY_DN24343_c0_g1~~TRINITY_DN24343_c0_g1_i2.p1  ORF type:complete len:268 (+),score=75.63 TRINITY_DN24343_c0_g1_i2:42-806(+)
MRGHLTLEELEAMEGATVGEKLLKVAFKAKDEVPHVVGISGFSVGAAILTDKGVYCGVNMEGRDMAYSMHAEQSAVHHVLGRDGLGEGVKMIAITASPCGFCRQLLSELYNSEHTTVVLPDGPVPLTSLLPNAFSPSTVGLPPLGKATPPSFGPSQSSWALSPAAVTLTFPTHTTTGFFMESVAHNMSIPAATAAFNIALLEGATPDDFKQCVSVKLTTVKNGTKLNHEVATREAVDTHCPHLKGAFEVEVVEN